MRWSPEPLKIGPRDGFDGTDLFQYSAFGERLAKLIGSLEDDPVLLLDGPWGSGKTTFAQQWAGILRNQGHAVIHFDAFAADHHKDPFLVLVEEVHCLANEAGLALDSPILDSFTKGAAAVGKELGLAVLEATSRRQPIVGNQILVPEPLVLHAHDKLVHLVQRIHVALIVPA